MSPLYDIGTFRGWRPNEIWKYMTEEVCQQASDMVNLNDTYELKIATTHGVYEMMYPGLFGDIYGAIS